MAKIGAYEIHPLLDCVPRASPEQRAKIRESIGADGFDPDHPILMYGKLVINGRERLTFSYETNTAPLLKQWVPKGRTPAEIDAELRRKIKREDLDRRHLSDNDRLVCLAQLFKPLPPGRPAKAGEKNGPAESAQVEPITLQEGADAAGTSLATWKRTLAMVKGCIQPIIELVKGKQLSPSDASNISDLTDKQQAACLREVNAEKSHSLTDARARLFDQSNRTGMSKKTARYVGVWELEEFAESPDLYEETIRLRNEGGILRSVAMEGQPQRPIERCARCGKLLFEGDARVKNESGAGWKCRECPGGRDGRK